MWHFLLKPTKEGISTQRLIVVLVICNLSKEIFFPYQLILKKLRQEKIWEMSRETTGETIQSHPPYTPCRANSEKKHKTALNPNNANCWTVSTYSSCILWQDSESCLYRATQKSAWSNIWILFAKLFTCISSTIFALFSSEQIEMQLAEYHKLARKLKLIPVSAENSKGHDFEIQFNPEAGPNCLVKYRTQIKVSRVNTECFCCHSQKNVFLWKYWKGLNLSMKLHSKPCVMPLP